MPAYVTIFVVWITEKCNTHSVFRWFMHLEIDRFQARRWWRMHVDRNVLRAIISLLNINIISQRGILRSTKQIYVG